MEAQTQSTQVNSTANSRHLAPIAWTAETILASRKERKLTQAELAVALGCRQQTISEWEMNQYAPKNAYQKLLNLFFAKDGGVAQDEPSFTVTIEQLRGTIRHMEMTELTSMIIGFAHAQDTFKMFDTKELLTS